MSFTKGPFHRSFWGWPMNQTGPAVELHSGAPECQAPCKWGEGGLEKCHWLPNFQQGNPSNNLAFCCASFLTQMVHMAGCKLGSVPALFPRIWPPPPGSQLDVIPCSMEWVILAAQHQSWLRILKEIQGSKVGRALITNGDQCRNFAHVQASWDLKGGCVVNSIHNPPSTILLDSQLIGWQWLPNASHWAPGNLAKSTPDSWGQQTKP